MSADEIGNCRRGPAIVDRREASAGHHAQQLDIEMAARSDAESPVVHFARMRLAVSDQFADGLRRDAGMHDQRLRAVAEAADRLEIAERIIFQVRVEMRAHHERRVGTDQQGVTVRRCAQHDLGSELRVRARPVVDDDLLTPALGETLAEQPGDDIGDAAGGIWHHDAHRLGRIGLRRTRRAACDPHDQGGDDARCDAMRCPRGHRLFPPTDTCF
jgi:hypothetical protein